MGDGILGNDVIEEREVWLVGVIGRIPVGDVRWRTTNAIELKFEEWKHTDVKP